MGQLGSFLPRFLPEFSHANYKMTFGFCTHKLIQRKRHSEEEEAKEKRKKPPYPGPALNPSTVYASVNNNVPEPIPEENEDEVASGRHAPLPPPQLEPSTSTTNLLLGTSSTVNDPDSIHDYYEYQKSLGIRLKNGEKAKKAGNSLETSDRRAEDVRISIEDEVGQKKLTKFRKVDNGSTEATEPLGPPSYEKATRSKGARPKKKRRRGEMSEDVSKVSAAGRGPVLNDEAYDDNSNSGRATAVSNSSRASWHDAEDAQNGQKRAQTKRDRSFEAVVVVVEVEKEDGGRGSGSTNDDSSSSSCSCSCSECETGSSEYSYNSDEDSVRKKKIKNESKKPPALAAIDQDSSRVNIGV